MSTLKRINDDSWEIFDDDGEEAACVNGLVAASYLYTYACEKGKIWCSCSIKAKNIRLFVNKYIICFYILYIKFKLFQ